MNGWRKCANWSLNNQYTSHCQRLNWSKSDRCRLELSLQSLGNCLRFVMEARLSQAKNRHRRLTLKTRGYAAVKLILEEGAVVSGENHQPRIFFISHARDRFGNLSDIDPQ